MMQGGDFTNFNGTGGESVYGTKFADENFRIKHKVGGLLSMANSGKNSNGSQFFVTFEPTPWLDGKHVVFGRVVKGMEFVKMIENIKTKGSDRPKSKIEVVDCGIYAEAKRVKVVKPVKEKVEELKDEIKEKIESMSKEDQPLKESSDKSEVVPIIRERKRSFEAKEESSKPKDDPNSKRMRKILKKQEQRRNRANYKKPQDS